MAGQDVRHLVIELVPHADAGDRGAWRGNQDERPLTELGRRQSEVICKSLREGQVDGLYASPALRSQQTVEPLARSLGIEVVVLANLREEDVGDAFGSLTERAIAAIGEMKARHPVGRVVACSHGDLIPALADRVSSDLGVDVRSLTHRGQRYRIEIGDDISAISRIEIVDFPR